MSLAKVNRVAKARKDQGKCEVCQNPLPAGSSYLWYSVGFRSSFKHVRCLDHPPTMSERESSQKAQVWAAQENFEAAVTGVTSEDELQTAYDEFVEDLRSYAEDRRAALDEWEYGNSQLEEYAEDAEAALNEVEDWQAEEFGGDPEHDDDEDKAERAAHLAAQVDEALNLVQGISV